MRGYTTILLHFPRVFLLGAGWGLMHSPPWPHRIIMCAPGKPTPTVHLAPKVGFQCYQASPPYHVNGIWCMPGGGHTFPCYMLFKHHTIASATELVCGLGGKDSIGFRGRWHLCDIRQCGSCTWLALHTYEPTCRVFSLMLVDSSAYYYSVVS